MTMLATLPRSNCRHDRHWARYATCAPAASGAARKLEQGRACCRPCCDAALALDATACKACALANAKECMPASVRPRLEPVR